MIEVAGLDVAGDASATPAPHCTQSQVSGVPWGAGYFEECLAIILNKIPRTACVVEAGAL